LRRTLIRSDYLIVIDHVYSEAKECDATKTTQIPKPGT